MIIKLTKTELLTIICAHFSIGANAPVTITDWELTGPGKELADKLRAVLANIDYKVTQKIAAIKALREITSVLGFGMGLADAKYAVENWDKFITHVEKTGVIPKDLYYNPI